MLPLRNRIGTQPHGHVSRLHGLTHHTYQVVIEGLQIRLLPQLDGERFEGLPRIILAPIEAAIYEGLDATTEGVEKGRYQEGRGHDGQGGPLSREGDEYPLQHHDTA